MSATYEPIATTTLGSAAATITFSSIPATYTDLRLVIVYDMNSTATMRMLFNDDSVVSTSTSCTRLNGNGSTVTSSNSTNTGAVDVSPSMGSGFWRLTEIDIFSYAGSKNKTFLAKTSADNNGGGNMFTVVGLWRNISAINQLVFRWSGSQTFSAGSTATLYGIKAE